MPSAVDECVESVLDDNPEMDESRAWAICKAQQEADVDEPRDVVHLADTDLMADGLDAVCEERPGEWGRFESEQGVAWVGLSTGAAVYQSTPEGIPEDARSVSDRDECEGRIVEGERGGLWCVAGDGDDDTTDARPRAKIREEVESAVESGDRTEVSGIIGSAFGVETVELPRDIPDDQLVEFTTTLTQSGELGIGETVEEVHTHSREASGVYQFNTQTLSFNSTLDEADFSEYVEDGEAVGDDMEWLVMHELAHAEHDATVDDIANEGEFFDQGLAVSRDGEWVGRERIDLVDDEVSDYARTNPAEFVAEVYAGLAIGRDFPDEVMDLYEEWDGPDSWQTYRGEQE